MWVLHTVNKSPFGNSALMGALGHAAAGDAVLLIEDGVYGALNGTAASKAVADKAAQGKLYVLSSDLAGRGLANARLIDGIRPVDYAGFVDLVAEYKVTQAWL
jgi:tRNA 2-thiouridine synthesizing protein B